jgi:hypothetical protein
MKKLLAIIAAILTPMAALAQYPSPTFNSVSIQNPLPLSSGGVGANTASGARAILGAASNGSNSDITNILGTMHSPASAPSSVCSANSFSTAFNCDLSNLNLAIGTSVSGIATLGQPTTGYSITPNLASLYTYYSNTSGWNQSTSGNNGRTGAGAFYTKVDNYGQGDAYAYFANAFTLGAKPGATSWLANPAGVLFAGQSLAGSSGVYLQGVGDINLVDNGFDVAAAGIVNNYFRTNNTGALGTVWMGVRQQSQGTKPIDAFFSASGPARVGVDLVQMTGSAIGIALPVGVGIYGNATNPGNFPNTIVPGTDVIQDNATNGWQLISGGVDSLNVGSTQVVSNVPLIAPTATAGTNTTQVATTAFVNSSITAATGRLIGVQTFSSSGTYTPTSGTTSIIVEVQAPGGSGGGAVATSTAQSAAGSGGGAGSYAKVRLTSGFSGATVTVPAAPTGTAGAAGTAGGIAAFGSFVSCPGGTPGALGSNYTTAGFTGVSAAAACTVSGGTNIVNNGGAPGGIGIVLTPGTVSFSGPGGSSIYGAGASGRSSSGAGSAGAGYGSGGSGANLAASQSAAAGGNAAGGEVIVYEYQ